MLKRIITSAVALCVLLPILLFSETFVFPAAIGIISLICIFEMLRCMRLHKKYYLSVPLYVAAVSVPWIFRYAESVGTAAAICFIIAVCFIAVVFTAVIRSHGKFAFSDGMAMYMTCLYILAALNSIVYVRDFGENGKYIYLMIFIGAWITDTFAYFTGMLLGRHKLIEDVSPKKTVEGSIGGIAFCVLSFVAFGIIVDTFFDGNANIIFLAISGVAVSVISQIGDLIMSVIKRHYGIKDYGKLFPGHGGMLDRFDSVLAVSLGMAAICALSGLLGVELL